MSHGMPYESGTTYPRCSLNRWFVPKTMSVDCPYWVVYPVKISTRNIETSKQGDENTVKIEVGQCISKARRTHSFHHFSAKKKNLLCFWSFLVALTMGYKIIHFPNSENIGHLRNTQAHYSWVIIFCFSGCYSADFDQTTAICIKTNDILESPSKTESTNVCFKRFRELFSPKN